MAHMGTVIEGKYEILKQIGRGGMSVVYLAMDKRLNKQWAVKEVRKFARDKKDKVVIQSLLAEADMIKKLDHPALPRIVDIINHESTIYIVMDYIEGESLDKILKAEGIQPQDKVIEWAKQLCDVLQYLHSQTPPIIYRDMKPANVMLKPEGIVKVIDFGIAREYKEENLKDTTILGTEIYAPPEQCDGSSQTDARSDIYSLGMTLYQLLTGKTIKDPPYKVVPIRQWNPALSGGLEKIIMKCTQPNPADRYQNCKELMYDLEHYDIIDEAYRKKQKRKLGAFIGSLSMSVVMAGVGTGSMMLMNHQISQNYENLINTSGAYDVQEEAYKEAVDTIGEDTRAYMKLLELYAEEDPHTDGELSEEEMYEAHFTDDESDQFMALYNANKSAFDSDEMKSDDDVLEMNFQLGYMYFSLYNGGDNSTRTRMLKALPYFEAVVENGDSSFDKYSLAESYWYVCQFYSDFVLNSSGVKEPTKENYEKFLEDAGKCIDNLADYDTAESSYVKLTLYQNLMNLMNDHRKGMAMNGVEPDSVYALYDKIKENAEGLFVTREDSLAVQEAIIENHEPFKEAFATTHTNVEERG